MTQGSPASGGGALLYDKKRPSDRALYDCASGGEPCRMKSESDLRRNARCGRGAGGVRFTTVPPTGEAVAPAGKSVFFCRNRRLKT